MHCSQLHHADNLPMSSSSIYTLHKAHSKQFALHDSRTTRLPVLVQPSDLLSTDQACDGANRTEFSYSSFVNFWTAGSPQPVTCTAATTAAWRNKQNRHPPLVTSGRESARLPALPGSSLSKN